MKARISVVDGNPIKIIEIQKKKIIVFSISCTHIAIPSQFQPHVAPPCQRRSKTSKQQTKTEKPEGCNPERWRQQLSPMIGVSSNVCKHPFRRLHQLPQKARYQITAFLLLARANRWQIAGHNLKKQTRKHNLKSPVLTNSKIVVDKRAVWQAVLLEGSVDNAF